MKKIDFLWIVISMVIGLISYLTTGQFIIGLALVVIYISYYFLIGRKKFCKYYSEIDRVHYCYHFINSFLVTLSVKESFEDAYQSAIRVSNKALLEEVEGIKKFNVYDRVNYLRSFFNLAIYKMFLNILDLYQDQGGNVLSMSGNLIRECTRTEKILNESLSIGRKHIVEFLLLWVMSFGIVLFMRFGITDFYMMMLNNSLFVIMLFIYFLICLVSVHLFVDKFTNLSIKEDNGQ